jgi:chromosome segregation ATPase
MKNANRTSALLSFLPALLLGAALQGCATQGHDRATSAANKMSDLRSSIVATKDAIAPVSASLTELLKDTVDAPKAFDQFAKATDKLADATKQTQSDLADLRAEGAAYVAEWEKQNAAITDADIKESAEDRRKSLSKKLEGVTKAMDEAAGMYPPYLARMKDARTALSNDLTKAGIKSIDSTLSHLINEGADVTKALDKVVKELDATIPAFQAAKAPPPPAK